MYEFVYVVMCVLWVDVFVCHSLDIIHLFFQDRASVGPVL